VERVRVREVKVKRLEEVPFGAKDLFVAVATVGHVEEVLDGRADDLLVLGCDEEGGRADELELDEGDDPGGKEPIDDVDGEEERFGQEAELLMDLDEPVDEDCSHLPLELGLDGHVVRIREGGDLRDRRMGRCKKRKQRSGQDRGKWSDKEVEKGRSELTSSFCM
jgi:hypothetical protein